MNSIRVLGTHALTHPAGVVDARCHAIHRGPPIRLSLQRIIPKGASAVVFEVRTSADASEEAGSLVGLGALACGCQSWDLFPAR